MKTLFTLFFYLIASFLFAQEYAKKQLDASPRHHEWITINNKGKVVHCFVAFPEVSKNADVVIAIHENRGLNVWARSFADQLAAKGFVVIAPDLLSSFSDQYQKTSDFPSSDEARKAIYALEKDQVTSDLNAVFDYAKTMDASTGEVSVVGFCWGGSQSFRYATHNASLKTACVFYGTAPKDKTTLATIETPIYGFYGGDDQRVNSTLEATKKAMNEYEHTYDYEIYDGAGHAFMRRGDSPDAKEANKVARDKAWERLVGVLMQQ